MPMNLVIQEKRKELGLTQEQVAEYLNVSIPAVSKWEKGTTCPDISLLAPLARFLKTDLNTLCCFQENMPQQEITLFCKEITAIVQMAQEMLDLMPDKGDVMDSMADKLMLQVIIYQHQGKVEKAAKELQNALLMAVNKVQLLLSKMVDAELAADEIQAARNIAKKASRMTELFDLWEYNAFVAPLQVAGAEKNADECICLLRKLLSTMLTPWDMDQSPLYCRIAKPSADSRQMLSAILTEMERDPAYDFLQERQEFHQLIAEYRALTEK